MERTIVAPFFADTDIRTSGQVFYRHYDILSNPDAFTQEEVKHVDMMIQKFGEHDEFSSKFILFVTWNRVRPFQETFNKSTVNSCVTFIYM